MIEISYSQETYYGEAEIMHRWVATDNGTLVGELYARIDSEIIMAVEVNADRRGEGIARSLYEAADAKLANLRHAPAVACTEDGLAFAEAMGGPVADASELPELDGYEADLY